jgi:hypothetical protein
MKSYKKIIIIQLTVIVFFTSCSTLEKTSTHGFNSGYYKLHAEQKNAQNVYLDVTDEKIDVYYEIEKQPDKNKFLTIALNPSDSLVTSPIIFSKKSLDIDLTAILLKYRPAVYGLPGQLSTDFNVALYAGWRHDVYNIKSKMDPLGKGYNKFSNWGYDFGFFTGPGSASIGPFTTQNQITDEYSGLIIQTGFAGFIELNVASFGFAVGYDYLLSQDRKIWTYNNRPWLGFIVGIALN